MSGPPAGAAGRRPGVRPGGGAGDGLESLVDRLWVVWPLVLTRVLPWPGVGLTDGQWVTRWPKVAVALPPVSGLVGAALGLLHPGVWVAQWLAVVLLLYAAALLAGQLGWWAGAGFLVTFVGERAGQGTYPGPPVAVFAGVLGALLLGTLIIGGPLLVTGLVAGTARAWQSRAGRGAALVAVASAAAGFYGWAWPQAMAVLSRPLAVWGRRFPDVADIRPLQTTAWLVAFGLVGAAAAGARVVLDARMAGRPLRRAGIVALQFSGQSGRLLPQVAPWAATGLAALTVTFLMSGLITAWWQAVATLAALLLLARARQAVSAAPWWRRAGRIPYAVRLAAAVGLGLLVNRAILGLTFHGALWDSSGSMLPLLIGVLVGLAITVLLTAPVAPAGLASGGAGKARGARGRAARHTAVVLVVGGLAALDVLGDVRAARADNCSSLTDCFFTIAAALLVIAILALIIALILGAGPGALALAAGGTMSNAAAVAVATNVAVAAAQGAAVSAAAGTILQMAANGTPGNNQAQNKQFRDAVRSAERDLGRKLSKDEIRQVHDAISGQNFGFRQIIEEILSMFGGG